MEVLVKGVWYKAVAELEFVSSKIIWVKFRISRAIVYSPIKGDDEERERF